MLAATVSAGLCGCPSDARVDGADASDEPSAPRPDVGVMDKAAAHDAALDRFLGAARPALDAADPVAAFRLGRGPLTPPGASGLQRAALRDKLTAAQREGKDLSPLSLSAERGMLLRAVQAGLGDVDRRLRAKTPLRTDPSAFSHETNAFVDLVAGVLADGPPGDVDVRGALRALVIELQAARAALGGASPESLAAGAADADALAGRLRALAKIPTVPDPSLTAAAEEAAAEAEAMAERWRAIAKGIDEAKPGTWDARLNPAADPDDVRRLPARWGAQRLRVVLADEELLEVSASDTLAALLGLARRLTMMRAKGEDVSSGKPAPVDAARCEAARAAIVTWATTQPTLKDATLDCASFVRRMTGRELDDVDLERAVAHYGVVEPTRWARRRAVEPALAMASGRAVPYGQALALQITILSGAGRKAAMRRAVDDARRATCAAAAAMVLHGDLADTPTLSSRLGADCNERDAEAWTAHVTARPRAALDGLGLLALGRGPADAVAMHEFWWVPLGLVRPLARPPDPDPGPPAEVKVEPL